MYQRTRNAVAKCVLRAYNAAKCDCGRDSAPDPAGIAPTSLARFKAKPLGRGQVEGKGEGREVGIGPPIS